MECLNSGGGLFYRFSKEDQTKEHWGGEWSTAEEVRDDLTNFMTVRSK